MSSTHGTRWNSSGDYRSQELEDTVGARCLYSQQKLTITKYLAEAVRMRLSRELFRTSFRCLAASHTQLSCIVGLTRY